MGFEGIVGQDTLLTALNRALERGEVGHAYLFSGPEGSGKKTIAYKFAQALNCSSSEVGPCDSCLSCRKIQKGSHPDIYTLAPEGTWLKIGQLKDIKENLFLLPVEGGKKVCVIHGADYLTLSAANSILKILEDPPQDVVFLLLSSRPWALLSTIVSRCIHLPLKPLSVEDMNELLSSRFNLSGEEKELTAALANGNPGKGIEIASLSEQWFQKYKQVLQLVADIELGTFEDIFIKAEELAGSKDIDDLLELMLLIYRDRLVLNYGGGEKNVIIKSMIELISSETESLDCYSLLRAEPIFLEKIGLLLMNVRQQHLLNNVNLRLALEEVFLKMRGVV